MQLWPDITHADVDPDSQVAQEEIFGPVLTVTPYDTDDEAGAIANNTIYGLSGEVSSADVDRAFEVAKRMRTGNVTINGKSHFGIGSPARRHQGLGAVSLGVHRRRLHRLLVRGCCRRVSRRGCGLAAATTTTNWSARPRGGGAVISARRTSGSSTRSRRSGTTQLNLSA